MALSLWTPLLLLFTLGCRSGAAAGGAMKHRQVDYPLAFSTSWQILGPFQIGTREATWGADPLEYVGGFRELKYDQDAQFRSSLPVNGTANWSIMQAKQTTSTPTSANASLSVSYSNVNWDFLKVVYGWAAVQYQAWARGEITVLGDETQHVILYTDWILEFWVNDTHYFGGDFFTFRKAPPVLHLEPGTHKIDLRLVRDVRALGGINEPTIDVLLELQQTTGTLELASNGILMSDVVDGKLASPVASVALRNAGQDDVEIVDIQPSNVRLPLSFVEAEGVQLVVAQSPQSLTAPQLSSSALHNASGVIIVAGQTRPVAFNVSLPSHNASSLTYVVRYKSVNGKGKIQSFSVTQNLTKLSVYEPHKITYLHPGGMASYAMLRPPAKNATCNPGTNTTLPVLLGLHGAGLEADNGMVAHALDPVADLCAWVLFPTGVTPWSGDDWHNWGFTDVEAAVDSILDWIEFVKWKGPGVDVHRWIVSGHSNGGQGTWYALTHRPDRIVAAAPVSGYASIQKYVPYELWQPADPRRTAIISGSLNSYRHEMLMENAQGIPIVQQHGEIDDNVPAYNSRLLSQMLFQAGTNSSYYELPGKNHWFDTVMTTDDLKDFYRRYTTSTDKIPRRLQNFSIVVADPGDMGPKGGLRVTHLEDPGQYGRVYVESHTIRTSNVLGLELETQMWQDGLVTVDGIVLDVSVDAGEKQVIALTQETGSWKTVTVPAEGPNISTRSGLQLGAMTAILRTHGPFTIRHQGPQTAHIALQVSRNLHQYFSADSNIVAADSDKDVPHSGNVITIAVGEVPSSVHPDFPITAGTAGISVRDSKGRSQTFMDDVGAAFLRPLAGQRLELVLWGLDSECLSQAARLLPMLTGVGQPDFVVLGKAARWRGVEGSLALGFLDRGWNVTHSSVVW